MNGQTWTTARTSYAVLLLIIMIAGTRTAQAQFDLAFSPPALDGYPGITVPVQLRDNTATVTELRPDMFEVREDGVQIPFTLTCDDSQVAPKVNFAFLMDVSFSMGFREDTTLTDKDSIKWRTAKQVFTEAYDKLRPADRAVLISFAGYPDVEEGFTGNVQALADATYGMRLRAGTAIYDAVRFGAEMLESQSGKNIIILLTDGVDNRSYMTRQQCIDFAWTRNIPVHVIGLGLYKDDNQPNRVDTDTLRSIADGTGGKAYFAPTSDQLAGIFNEIFEGVFSLGCSLDFQSLDTCRDGRTRTISIDATIEGMQFNTSFDVTPPDERPILALEVQDPGSLEDDMTHDVQVSGRLLRHDLPADKPLSLVVDVEFDAGRVALDGVETAGTLMEGAVVGITSLSAGVARVQFESDNFLRPDVYEGERLPWFMLELRVLHLESLEHSALTLQVRDLRQDCPAIGSGSSMELELLGCPDQLTLVIDTVAVARSGSVVPVALHIPSMLDHEQDFEFSFVFTFDHAMLEYVDFDVQGSLAEHMGVDIAPLGPGRLLVTSTRAHPAATNGRLITLLFRAVSATQSARLPVGIEAPLFEQTCVQKVTLIGDHIMFEGDCQPLVRYKGLQLGQNTPNPMTGAAARISYRVPSEGDCRLEIFDSFGRSVAVPVNEHVSEGAHEVSFDAGSLPNGVYYYRLSIGGQVLTRKLLLAR